MVTLPPPVRSLLAFRCDGLLFALDSSRVQEMLWLPELSLVEECPPFVAGVANRRGVLLPVVDLATRLGHRPRHYQCSDSLIIVHVPPGPSLPSPLKFRVPEVGVVASELLGVFEVSDQDVEPSPFAVAESQVLPQMVAGRAKVNGEVFMLLDLGLLFENDFDPAASTAGPFCPGANSTDREIFHRRSLELSAIPPRTEETSTAVVVMRWGNQSVCVELSSVFEFSPLAPWVPVPCCPAHVVGAMNLRGSVLTLIDLCGLLGFPQAPVSGSAKVVVTAFGGFPVGVLADEILEVIDLAVADVVRAPSPSRPFEGDFVRGVTPYGDGMMTVLNLKEILAWEGLAVNEEV